MRIDPDECRDPDLLAAEVRRLQAVIASSEPTHDQATLRSLSEKHHFPGAGKMVLTITAEEHDALEFAVETGRVATHDQATLRSLLERLK